MPSLKRSEAQLHRLDDNANDYDTVPDALLTAQQRIAKRTKGKATIANAISLVGTLLVIDGLHDVMTDNKLRGFAKIVGGRALDLVDGWYADKTGTKTRFGRDFDPAMDGVQLFAASVLLANKGILPNAPAAVMAVQKGVETVAAAEAKLNDIEINPTGEGKTGAFLQWTGISAFVLRGAIGDDMSAGANSVLAGIGWAGTVGGSAYKLPATRQYVEEAFALQPGTTPAQEMAVVGIWG